MMNEQAYHVLTFKPKKVTNFLVYFGISRVYVDNKVSKDELVHKRFKFQCRGTKINAELHPI